MTTPVNDPSEASKLAEIGSATFTISVWVPIIALLLTAIGLGYTIWRSQTGQAEKKRLAGILCAAQLEGIAQQCLLVAHDYGTYESPEYHGVNPAQDFNEPTVKIPDIPNFETIENVATLGTINLNRLLSLRPSMTSIKEHLGHLWEHDHPDFLEGFERRRILMAGFGEYCARLAIDIRKSVGAPSISQVGPEAQMNLKAQLTELIGRFQVNVERRGFASPGMGPNDIFEATAILKTTYEAVFLPEEESHWPSNSNIERHRRAYSS